MAKPKDRDRWECWAVSVNHSAPLRCHLKPAGPCLQLEDWTVPQRLFAKPTEKAETQLHFLEWWEAQVPHSPGYLILLPERQLLLWLLQLLRPVHHKVDEIDAPGQGEQHQDVGDDPEADGHSPGGGGRHGVLRALRGTVKGLRDRDTSNAEEPLLLTFYGIINELYLPPGSNLGL